jgi:hypothetical protein
MPKYLYSFDLGALQEVMIAKGLPIDSMDGVPLFSITTARELTANEKQALSQWVLGAWSAVQVPVGGTLLTFVKEERIS